MQTNLIQNYLNKPAIPDNKGAEDFNIRQELANKTFIRPLKAKGRLVNSNPFDAPSVMVKDIMYDLRSLKHGVKGHANDHELGKLNDLGMKIGALAIAAYLFTKRKAPSAKGMEFVGPITFFASMALWPKLAIQLPAYLIHGVNVQKKYEDSFGRKKPFYQDHQFIPWDLYTDKQINAIGNRFGVPKDIPNRRDFIQEKMKKLALQNNTLWMLTAGFATPVMSALMCNALNKPLANYLNDINNKRADKLLEKPLESLRPAFRSDDTMKITENLINLYGGKNVDEHLIDVFSKQLTEGIDSVTAQKIKEDLTTIFLKENYIINNSTISNLHKKIMDSAFGIQTNIVPPIDEMKELLTKNNLFDSMLDEDKIKEAYSVISRKLKQNIILYNKKNLVKINPYDPQTKLLYTDIISSALKSSKTNLLDDNATEVLRKIGLYLTDLKADTAILDKYIYKKLASSHETVLANYWNEVTQSLSKTLGITKKEIADTRHDGNLVTSLFRSKLEKIASNDDLYKQVISEIASLVERIDAQIKSSDLNMKIDETKYGQLVDMIYNTAADKFKSLNMENTVKALLGQPYTRDGVIMYDAQGSLKNIQKNFAVQRLLGVKSSFYRLLNTLNLYKSLANADDELAQICKHFALSGHISDYSVKLPFKRNGVYLSNDTETYRKAFKAMFLDTPHPITENALKDTSLLNEFNEWRRLTCRFIGDSEYFAKPFHTVSGGKASDVTSQIKSAILGVAPDEMLTKVLKQKYNSSKWLKIFGGFGIALFTATVLAQFTFGKLKTPQKEKVKND